MGGTDEQPSFQGVLMVLLLKLANDHPYHTLPQVHPRCTTPSVVIAWKGLMATVCLVHVSLYGCHCVTLWQRTV